MKLVRNAKPGEKRDKGICSVKNKTVAAMLRILEISRL
jgi:hypothetical protein